MTTHFFLFTTGLVLITLYILFVLSLYFGMGRISSNRNTKKYRVSIVVAARNEEENIAVCIYALVSQDYPQDLLEIIVVDDRSEDTTGAILKEAAANNPAVSVISIEETPDDCAPKKYALTRGIEKASGEIICTTDADCVPPQEWVSEMVSRFTEDVGFVAGFSPQYVYSIHSKENVSAGKRDVFLAKDKQEKTGNRIDAGKIGRQPGTGLKETRKLVSPHRNEQARRLIACGQSKLNIVSINIKTGHEERLNAGISDCDDGRQDHRQETIGPKTWRAISQAHSMPR